MRGLQKIRIYKTGGKDLSQGHVYVLITEYLTYSGVRGDPLRNRFGRSRFLSSKEARTALEEFFAVRTEDGQSICPVIILGHALSGDTDKLWNLLKFNPNRLGNVVRQIDTQQIVRDMGYWTERNEVGLQKIVSNLGFEYRDAHTASNDAAMTLIAAVLLVLPRYGFGHDKKLQEVVDQIERLSQDDEWVHGSDKYCQRCHSRDHFLENGGHDGGRCKAFVYCHHCEAAGRGPSIARTHMTEDCISFALENGNSKKARLKREAAQKRVFWDTAARDRYHRRRYGNKSSRVSTM